MVVRLTVGPPVARAMAFFGQRIRRNSPRSAESALSNGYCYGVRASLSNQKGLQLESDSSGPFFKHANQPDPKQRTKQKNNAVPGYSGRRVFLFASIRHHFLCRFALLGF